MDASVFKPEHLDVSRLVLGKHEAEKNLKMYDVASTSAETEDQRVYWAEQAKQKRVEIQEFEELLALAKGDT